MIEFRRLTCIALAVAMTTGCAGLRESQDRVAAVQKTAESLKESVTTRATTAAVQRSVRPRLAGAEVYVRSSTVLPEVMQRKVTFTTHGQSLAEALEGVSTMIGVPIRGVEAISQQATSQPGAAPGAPISGRITLEFSGTGKGLLDEIAARAGASWRYVPARQVVEFFRFETKTLSVYIPPGAQAIASSISLAGVTGGGGGGGGSGGGGGGNVSITQNLNIDPWQSLMGGVRTILSEATLGGTASGGATASATAQGSSAGGMAVNEAGGRATANPELGLLTVTARPEALERVISYIDSINARFAQNILVDVKILSVSLDRQNSLGFSLDLLYQRLNRYGVSVVGGSPLAPATGTPGRFGITSTDPNSRWNGSEIVAQALAQFGTVALQTQGQVLAINGQPSPIQVANEVNYVASSATTQTPNVGSTTTLTPGTKVVGFTANFIPVVLGNNQILLNYQLQISQLTALTQITSGNSLIQTPQISSQSLPGRAYMRDGEAIVLFGFDQSRDSSDAAASINGASKAARSERQMVVIVIQVNGGTRNAA